MLNKNQNYINTLMNLYKDMLVENDIHNSSNDAAHYSDTMLHNIISIISKLNNNTI